jgi:hypothetical protein
MGTGRDTSRGERDLESVTLLRRKRRSVAFFEQVGDQLKVDQLAPGGQPQSASGISTGESGTAN